MFRNNLKTWPLAARRLYITALVPMTIAAIVGNVVAINHLVIPLLSGTLSILMFIAVWCIIFAIDRRESHQVTDQEGTLKDKQE